MTHTRSKVMKMFLKSFKERQGGFTLVELMVVVAIIGLLSSVALPNFRKYQAKSKMSEAKLQLASLYTAESAFFSDFNIYATCLAYMGYDPKPEKNQRYFAVGFTTGATIAGTAWDAAVNSGLQTNANSTQDLCGNGDVVQSFTWFEAGKGTGSSIASSSTYITSTLLGTQATSSTQLLDGDTSSTGMTYRAGAGGVIDGNYTANSNAALITIDNNKRIMVRRNGY